MTNPIKRFKNSRARQKKRIKIMGKKGVSKQDASAFRAGMSAMAKGTSIEKAKGQQAIKRVGEYKAAAKGTGEADAHSIEGRKRYKSK